MEAFSILNIPDYQKKRLKRSYIWSNIDYKRFNIKNRDILFNLSLMSKANDWDNADVKYEGEVVLKRIQSPRGIAHAILLPIIGGKPISFGFVEVYAKWQGLKGSVGRIDFKWSFFHFYEQIPLKWREIYEKLVLLAKEGIEVRETRKDICFDFTFPFPQNGESWIFPSKNSKREVECYRHEWKWNSFWYLAEKNSAYGVRMYNKIVDIKKNQKEFWYGGEGKIPEKWTRIEFEFYPPYSLMDDETLMKLVASRIMGSYKKITIGLPYRPCLEFQVERAYNYFSRYAKNHGITVEQFIDEIVAWHIHVENLKEYHTLPENIWQEEE